jgi:hypothetical protein
MYLLFQILLILHIKNEKRRILRRGTEGRECDGAPYQIISWMIRLQHLDGTQRTTSILRISSIREIVPSELRRF